MQDYLPRFLEELPKQTIFDDVEVVLDLNEGTPTELELAHAFVKKHPGRLKLLVTDPVAPIGVSMNACIRAASAPIVAMWNVDDLRTPDSLERQLQGFSDHPHTGVIHGNFTIVSSFGSTKGKLIDHHGYTYNTPEELRRSMVLGPFFAFRKDVLEKSGYFDEQFKTGADFDLALRLAYTSEVHMVADGILGYYLDEGKGASTRGDGRQPIERTAIELRYGILDKVDARFIPEALKYDIRHIINDGKKILVKDLVHEDYEELRRRNDFREIIL